MAQVLQLYINAIPGVEMSINPQSLRSELPGPLWDGQPPNMMENATRNA